MLLMVMMMMRRIIENNSNNKNFNTVSRGLLAYSVNVWMSKEVCELFHDMSGIVLSGGFRK